MSDGRYLEHFELRPGVEGQTEVHCKMPWCRWSSTHSGEIELPWLLDLCEEHWISTHNLKFQCYLCGRRIPINEGMNTGENRLTVSLSGGYGEFVDEMHPMNYYLCHECGHKLTDLLRIDTEYWHKDM